MRTSLNNIQLIEAYLQGMMSIGDRLAFEARLILYPSLRQDLYYQKKINSLIKIYHREKVKEELEDLHYQIFNDPSNKDFQQKIFQLFKNIE